MLERHARDETEHSRLYLYETDSFVPMALVDAVAGGADETPARVSAPVEAEDESDDDDFAAELRAAKGQLNRPFAAQRAAAMQQAGPTPAAAQTEAKVTKPAEPKPRASRILYLHCDHLGTPQELTDSDGAIVWSADYEAWGKVRNIERPQRPLVAGNTALKPQAEALSHAAANAALYVEPVGQNLRFQGQYFDEETGLHYNRFRYYDPDVGRFVSQDPIGLEGGVNLFQYAPNPITWIDPLGLNRKPNQAKRPCGCNKWRLDRVDRECKGHVPGVGFATYVRDPLTGLWYSKDQTAHGGSAFKMFTEKGGKLIHEADLNEYGDKMPKHKSEVGKEVDLKKLKCKDAQ